MAMLSLVCTFPWWVWCNGQPVVVQSDEAFVMLPVLLAATINIGAVTCLAAPVLTKSRWPRGGMAWASAIGVSFVPFLYVPTLTHIWQLGVLAMASAAISAILAFATATALESARSSSRRGSGASFVADQLDVAKRAEAFGDLPRGL